MTSSQMITLFFIRHKAKQISRWLKFTLSLAVKGENT